MQAGLVHKLTNDLFTIEYTWVDGGWTLKDSFLVSFYHNLRRRDLIFYNVEDLEHWNPLPYFRNVQLFVAFNKEGKCLGGYWLSSKNSLNCNAFFNCGLQNNAFENPTDYIKVAHIGLKFLLDRPDIKILFGETSITNKAIIALSEYFGFQKLGVVPNGHYHNKEKAFCDTVFMWIDKEHLRKIDEEV